MSGILWLASYPKSGNTWLRAFLANLLANRPEPVDINALPQFGWGDAKAELYEKVAGKPLSAMDDAELHRLRPQVHRIMATMRGETLMSKTHNAFVTIDGVSMITPEVTAGAIYVVRNPLDVAISYAHHFGLDIDAAIEAMAFEDNHITTMNGFVWQGLGSWRLHVKSWVEAKSINLHLLRYEDMVAKPKKAFGGVVKFLGLPAPPNRIAQAIKFSSFKVMAEQEKSKGFVERSANNDRFFRSGRSGGWRSVLSKDQVARVIEAQRDVMIEMRYLRKDGKLLV